MKCFNEGECSGPMLTECIWCLSMVGTMNWFLIFLNKLMQIYMGWWHLIGHNYPEHVISKCWKYQSILRNQENSLSLSFKPFFFKHWAKFGVCLILPSYSAQGKDRLNRMRVNEKAVPLVVSFYKFTTLKKS